MTDNNVVVQAHNLSMAFKAENKKSAEIKAINDLNMQIKKGELTALVGPDGSGKTTLLRLIAGLYKATSGSLNVLGFDIDKHPQAVQDRISYMPQRFGLYEDLSVQENLDLYADLHGVPREVRSQRFKRLLEITDLTQFTERLAGQLSGGMKQKLGLACTLVRSPELLLLDEPSVGVDPLSRRDLWIIIEQLVQEESLSVIISTAYMDEAEKCGYVYIMYEGKILKQGSPEQLKEIAHGQTWKVKFSEQIKARTLQAQLLGNSVDIIDAVPKGEQVNFLGRQKELSTDILPQGLVAHRRSAELEDAFMMLLQQTQKQPKQISISEQAFQLEQIDNLQSEQPVIVVKDLVRTFGDFTAVSNTSFDVQRGEIFGLLGPNGAGKTTTFRMLCGLLPASSGYLEVVGKNLRTARAEARAKVGYVSQKFALYSNLTVCENLKFFGGAYGLAGKKLNQQIDKALQQYDLKPHIKSGDLPGGYKQRLSMATALLHEPEILFLDEPTSGIDPLARRSFWYSIGELANQGITIIITTHFMEEAEYCDRIAIQDAGKLLALGSPQQVRNLASQDKHIGDMNEAFIAIVEQARALRHAV
ncbi:ABC transporter ATP-binding protein [Acinetobacter seifertii]|uniref:ABC transporter ATP-binding protein n=1 Tax=Acinetobacter seifertii TaxID=1530123 RepID=A0A7H2SHM6_9GAMM|nr:ATP-binding cassette domain-containing protein [Acinetobacter seifertii]MBD1220242.1 ABC transporter ATP-binding protein [Acinetobacter seifertii]QNX21443.1 ABC transporter ATP-binding protein [Acinetobacter seifertii]QNX28057.1 ABC transporter ATP-binding protein [Acinetobacter seifertii]QNX39109.1 ABC transporter ATP-binding protein [Acinetobacter seifertii]QNX42729.1 ABC transporter ATP-binding protein [Acinetobacter seifertii]